jgi:hypothetical protein
MFEFFPQGFRASKMLESLFNVLLFSCQILQGLYFSF